MTRAPLLVGVVAALLLVAPASAQTAAPNTLTPAEKAAGWRLLFDGHSTAGWRNFLNRGILNTNGWVVEDGWLKKVARVRGGDIITENEFNDFELSWEWRIPPKANNGVKYFVTETRDTALGHEYQMIDDSTIHSPKGVTASFYDVLPPKPHAPIRFAPGINSSLLRVQGNHVEHWLNGEKVLEYELGSPEVLAAVAQSKFRTVKGFGTKIRGHILLTDHIDEAAFRNVKIRELSSR
jgi:hypothetical protein